MFFNKKRIVEKIVNNDHTLHSRRHTKQKR